MQLVSLLWLVSGATALYLTVPAIISNRPDTVTTSTDYIEATSTFAPSTTITAAPTQLILSSLMTIAPLSQNPLFRRQRCFNDQGFNVDCAVWTGYYYTWGGAGHPYAGGPGDGGGSGSSGTTVYRSAASGGIQNRGERIASLWWPISAAMMMVCAISLL